MRSIDGNYEDLYIINKSKFISFAHYIKDEEEAKLFLNSIREKYVDATHVCSAYVVSTPQAERADDDGEPSGTAGKPLLELIKKRKLSNVILVVVRYFGGIKLGAGGLVRAYTTAGAMVLDKANVVDYKLVAKYNAKIDSSRGASLRSSIVSLGGEIISCVYLQYMEVEFVGDIGEKLLSMYPGIELNKLGEELICQKSL